MSKYRRTRINDEVTRVVAEALRTVKDPRVANAMITITKADVSGDLKFAKIYFSVFGTEEGNVKEIKTGRKQPKNEEKASRRGNTRRGVSL